MGSSDSAPVSSLCWSTRRSCSKNSSSSVARAEVEARVEEEGGLARSFLREFRVLVGTSRFLEREVDIAVGD